MLGELYDRLAPEPVRDQLGGSFQVRSVTAGPMCIAGQDVDPATLARELERLGVVARPVVARRQEVAMRIDHDADWAARAVS
jgi:hypothetical protein